MEFDIDPVKYGVLWQKVEDYERRFDAIDKRQEKMQSQLETLCEMANRSKGGFWVGMAVVSAGASIVGFFAHWFIKPGS
jgi:hypothetical protein